MADFVSVPRDAVVAVAAGELPANVLMFINAAKAFPDKEPKLIAKKFELTGEDFKLAKPFLEQKESLFRTKTDKSKSGATGGGNKWAPKEFQQWLRETLMETYEGSYPLAREKMDDLWDLIGEDENPKQFMEMILDIMWDSHTNRQEIRSVGAYMLTLVDSYTRETLEEAWEKLQDQGTLVKGGKDKIKQRERQEKTEKLASRSKPAADPEWEDDEESEEEEDDEETSDGVLDSEDREDEDEFDFGDL